MSNQKLQITRAILRVGYGVRSKEEQNELLVAAKEAISSGLISNHEWNIIYYLKQKYPYLKDRMKAIKTKDEDKAYVIEKYKLNYTPEQIAGVDISLKTVQRIIKQYELGIDDYGFNRNSEFAKAINEVIKICNEKGITIIDIAKRLGVAERTVHMWRIGQTTPPDHMIQKVNELFDMDVPNRFRKAHRLFEIS